MPDLLEPRRTSCLCAAIACVGSLWACEANTSTEYTGEPLLELHGHISSLSEAVPTDALPAILYVDADGPHGTFAEVEVEGTFPANFVMTVYTPPPARSLGPYTARLSPEYAKEFPEEPMVAMGLLVAAPVNRPETVLMSGLQDRSVRCTERTGCTLTERWCSILGDCYEETSDCPDRDHIDPNSCMVVDRKGNQKLKSDAAYVVGAAQGMGVLYLPDGADKGSYTAYLFGANEGLEPGYWVYEVLDYPMEPEVECEASAFELAVARFNAERPDAPIPEETCDYRAAVCPGGMAFYVKFIRARVDLECQFGVIRTVRPQPTDDIAMVLKADGLPLLLDSAI